MVAGGSDVLITLHIAGRHSTFEAFTSLSQCACAAQTSLHSAGPCTCRSMRAASRSRVRRSISRPLSSARHSASFACQCAKYRGIWAAVMLQWVTCQPGDCTLIVACMDVVVGGFSGYASLLHSNATWSHTASEEHLLLGGVQRLVQPPLLRRGRLRRILRSRQLICQPFDLRLQAYTTI